jgi:hypothetical protein
MEQVHLLLRSFLVSWCSPGAVENFFPKIQSICNGKRAPITMQGLATAREKPPAQEQWRTMEKTMRRTMESRKSGRVLTRRGHIDTR